MTLLEFEPLISSQSCLDNEIWFNNTEMVRTHTANKGFTPLLVILLIAVVLLAGGFVAYFIFQTNPASNYYPPIRTKKVNKTPVSSTSGSLIASSTAQLTQAQIDAIPSWKTYVNTKYGYQITYPGKGVDYIGNFINCGQFIKQDPYSDTPLTDYDNFFGIKVITSVKSIKDYISETEKNATEFDAPTDNLYTLEDISHEVNADEAYILHPTAENPGSDNTPLVGIRAIYKKGSQMLLMLMHQNSVDGCGGLSTPSDVESYDLPLRNITLEEYKSLYDLYSKWDSARSLKFIQ